MGTKNEVFAEQKKAYWQAETAFVRKFAGVATANTVVATNTEAAAMIIAGKTKALRSSFLIDSIIPKSRPIGRLLTR
jgi:hypothetical protein